MKMLVRGLTVASLAAGVSAFTVAPALAHTEVGEGDLAMVVGFGTEPAYSTQPNSVEVLVTHDGEPVTDLRPGDLQVEVSYGDRSMTMDLEPNFLVGVYGEPGDYRGWFVPSQPGEYTFHITGTVDGEEVDETVTSGPGTFSDVNDIAELAFPAVDAPSNEELATRLEQESTRAADELAAVQATLAQAEDDASSARTTALIAILVGAIGVIAGIAGIAAARGARTRSA
ncbi:MAG TPA: hypothetical protein VLA82_09865 [Actinomycetota bacterium]|nr:hypothetical protein [Actinomycetota bacterium]